ncbi:hypothetical protein MIND_01218000 [Mycena indigotica]|uniref:Uncharacterized protein n=1 Tax=Mycena indigotica TaxID=2126181 RepID=A0A8H6S4K7_9AGAR|nr:uncharacterized protein MIND_01218000 [Mycena indigotica]KAF7291926.1 hypothetical protein MIND_01218000 [Mycena indigotica]
MLPSFSSFCGLVVFLLPVNKIIAALVAGILGLVLGFYTFMTILPLIQFDSPYRTPFSNAIWGLSRFCALLFYQPTRSASPATSPATLVDNMIVRAISPSVGRRERDVSALIWTVSSLSDDTEPQNFIETIPDAMWGSSEQHHGNVALMTRLCASEEVNLPYRIAELWRSRNDGLLTSDAIEKRDAACLKAFWALCNISAPHPTTPFILPPILEHIPLYPDSPHSPYSNVISSPFYISMKTMANWSGIGWLQMYLQQHASRWAGSAYSDPVRRYLFRSFLFSSSEIRAAMLTLKLSITNSKQFDMVSRELCTSVSHRLFFDYLQTATTCGLLPYRWQETLDTIYLNDLRSTISENALRELESTIDTVFSKVRRVPRLWEQAAAQTVMRVLCGLWRPQKAREIPMGIIAYLKYLGKDASRNSQVSLLFAGLYRHLWRCFPSTIALYSIESSAASANSHHSETALHDMLAVLWMSIDLTMESTGTARLPPPSEDESNAVIEALAICASPLALAVMLVVKAVLLWGQTNTAIPFALVRKRLFELNHLHSTDLGGKLEDVVIILSYLFEQRTVIAVTDVLRVINALRSLTFLKPYDRNDDLIVHDLHQTRFAHGLMKISHLPTQQWHLVVRRVFESPVFDAPEGLERFHWITEPAAQENLRIVQRQMAKFRDVEQFAIEL